MPLKRHVALQDLSRDHQQFLLHARSVRWVVEDDPRAEPMLDVIAHMLEFWKEHGEPHIREEEDVIYPFFLERAPLEQRKIRALLTDHGWLREKIAELGDLPPVEVGTPLLKSIGDYITNHVRHEEREIYELIQNTLSEDDLNELATRSLAFRQQHRTPDAIGPAQPQTSEDDETAEDDADTV